MSKIFIAGDAIVITSSVKMADLKMLEVQSPKSLILKGGDDGKTELFRIGTGSTGSINALGAVFSGVSRDGSELATITIPVSDIPNESVKGYIVDTYGAAISKLNKLEEQLPAAVTEVNDMKQAVESCITVG